MQRTFLALILALNRPVCPDPQSTSHPGELVLSCLPWETGNPSWKISHYLSPARLWLGRRKTALAQWWNRLSWWRKGLAVLGGIAASILLIIFSVLAAGATYYHHKAGQFDLNRLVHMPERSIILDRNGVELGFLHGHGENRVLVKKAEVADSFIKALLTREDSRFYWHGGIDWISVARAAQVNWKAESIEQGASTLTMQLARNALDLDRDRTYGRKLLEAALAKRIEWRFSKDEILELYMNRIYFGSGLYGIERAAQGYFKKPARDLSLSESALLAGLIRAPSNLSPFRNPEDAVAERDVVLGRMAEERRISRAEADAAKLEPVHLRPENERVAELDYIKEAVHRELDLLLDPKRIEAGGLTVRVTIDRGLQEAAEAALRKRLQEVEQLPGYDHPHWNPGPNPAIRSRPTSFKVPSLQSTTRPAAPSCSSAGAILPPVPSTGLGMRSVRSAPPSNRSSTLPPSATASSQEPGKATRRFRSPAATDDPGAPKTPMEETSERSRSRSG